MHNCLSDVASDQFYAEEELLVIFTEDWSGNRDFGSGVYTRRWRDGR